MNEMNTRADEIMGEINGYKQLLANSDYKALKYSEGLITDVEYAETKAFREDLRAKINIFEEELASLNE